MKRAVLTFCIVMFVQSVFAQSTLKYSDAWKEYQRGMEMWDNHNYLAARQTFENAKLQPFSNQSQPDVLLQNLDFYIAACAVENNDKDAEQLLQNYMLLHHETDKRRQIYFLLGKYYFGNKKYTDAITYLEKAKPEDLLTSQQSEYKFMLGYSYFTRKKFEEAKPFFKQLKGVNDKYFYPSNYYYAFICFYTKDFDESLKSFLAIQDSKMYAAVIPYYIAQIYYAKQEYKKTIDYIPTKVNDAGVMYKPELNFLLGQAYFQTSQYERALPLLDGFLSKQAKANKYEIYQLAYCQYKTGDYQRAIKNLVQLNLLNDSLGQNATYTLADCYLKTNQKDKARSAFQSASNMSFDRSIQQLAVFHYGKLSVDAGNYSEAVDVLKNYIEKNAGSSYYDEANELLATSLFQTKNYDAAYQLIEDNPNLRSPRMNETYQKLTFFRAIQVLSDGNPSEAEKLCDKSLKYPIDKLVMAKALYLKGEAQYQQNNFAGAASNFAKSEEIPGAFDKKDDFFSPFQVQYNIGYSFFKRKEYKYAAAAFERAIKDFGNTATEQTKSKLLPDTYLRFADCSFVTQQYDDALDAYSKIIGSNWSSAEYATYQKAILLGLKNRNVEKVNLLEQLIAKYPTSRYREQAYFEIGETHLEEGKYDAALTAYNNLLSKFPASVFVPKSYLKIALVTYNKDKKADAFAAYKKVVQQFPKTIEAKEALTAMKEISVEIGRTDEYVELASGFGSITQSEQDSLTYQAAETAYNNNDCARAIQLFSNYVKKFETGYFINEARFGRAECYSRDKSFVEAFEDYKAVIENRAAKFFERSLLKASGIAYFEIKNYNEAFDLYEKLLNAASNPPNTYSAQLGLLKTANKLEKHDKVIEYANLILQNNQLKENDLIEINYMKAKALYLTFKNDEALPILNKVAAAAVSEKAAECKYYACKILFEKEQYKASLDSCLKLKSRFANYELWVVKTFILMADNYAALDNQFQAKATLESIVANYTGDEKVLQEAREKLEVLTNKEIDKSKLTNDLPSDSLIMEKPLENEK
jgi:TolA-binding protein